MQLTRYDDSWRATKCFVFHFLLLLYTFFFYVWRVNPTLTGRGSAARQMTETSCWHAATAGTSAVETRTSFWQWHKRVLKRPDDCLKPAKQKKKIKSSCWWRTNNGPGISSTTANNGQIYLRVRHISKRTATSPRRDEITVTTIIVSTTLPW